MGLFRTPNVTTRAEKISTFTVSTAEYGSSVMEILGTTRISGNVLYYDDFTAHEHRETHRSGKGGGGKTTTITYTYTAAIILGLCEGPVASIGRVWIDKNIYTYPHESIGLNLFRGTQEQKPWGYVTSKHPDKALSYTGLAYMAGVVDLGSNASLPNYNFEVKGKLLDTGDGVDVNPADYILYIISKVGMENIEIVGLDNYRTYCKEADFLISTPDDATSSKAAREIINEIATLTNAYIFWSNDVFKIVPREDRSIGTWSPDNTVMYDLTPDDFLPQNNGACVTYSRKDSSELYNRFSVEFLNRANSYEKETVSYEDVDDIKINGVKQGSTTSAHYIYTKKRAVMLAEALARRNKYERNKYTFKLGWAFCRLEVGDLVTLTDPNIGLEKVLVMIDSLTESTSGELTFTAISRPPMVFGSAAYDVHENERPSIDFNFDPGDIEPPAIFQPDESLMYGNNEVWIGARGKKTYWGGCNVWCSYNNDGYKLVGTINTPAIMGTLAAPLGEKDTAAEVSISDQLVGGTVEDAENGVTLLRLEGESLSYTTATLLENGNYLLGGLVRGQYNTTAAAHSAGATITRCDSALLKTNFLDSDIGKIIYFKFTSFNVLNNNEQSLAEVPYYTYVVEKRDAVPPDVKGIDCVLLASGTRQLWWDFIYPTPNDIAGFEMRYNQGSNVTWENAAALHTGLITEQPFETQALRQGVHTVMIKAVDNSGNYSRRTASVILDLGDPLEENVLYKKNASESNWSEAIHNGLSINGTLTNCSAANYWSSEQGPYWLQPETVAWSEIYESMELSYQIKAPASGQFWVRYDIDGPAKVEYRIAGKESFWDGTSFWGTQGAAMWYDTQPLRPYTGKSVLNAGDTVQIIITAQGGLSEPTSVKELVAIIDVPDRQEHFENIEVSASGIMLPVKTPSYYTTAVRIDAIQNAGGNVARAAVIERNPCFIQLLDINNKPVSATVDVTWQGFIKEVHDV